MDRIKIKQKAKKIIKNNLWNIWKPYLIILTINIAISFLVVYIFKINVDASSFVDLIINFITLPLIIGYITFLLNFIRNKKAEINDIFSKINQILPIFLINLIVGVAVTIGAAFLLIPGIIIGLMFSMTSYLLADGETNIGTVLNKSINMMKGYKGNYFIFCLSFLGWILLGIVTFGLAFIYVIPYMNVANALYYEELKSKQLK